MRLEFQYQSPEFSCIVIREDATPGLQRELPLWLLPKLIVSVRDQNALLVAELKKVQANARGQKLQLKLPKDSN